MKILNLYCGIGGNRKLWGEEHSITAVELDPKIAAIYHDFFPKDKVIVADAHQYLLDHFKEYEFIWASPPCPTHSTSGRLRALPGINKTNEHYSPPKYPDMKLYEEILLLQGYFKGVYCVENVISWYAPLIIPKQLNKHYFWVNFYLREGGTLNREINKGVIKTQCERLGYKRQPGITRAMLRNCVEPETGKYIFDQMLLSLKDEKASLFV